MKTYRIKGKTTENEGHIHEFEIVIDEDGEITGFTIEEEHNHLIEDLDETKQTEDHIHELIIDLDNLDEATRKIVKKIKGGKLKRVKTAGKKGFKVVDGKVQKQTSQEKIARKRGSKKAARKRKGKIAQIRKATRISLRKRKARGL